MAISAFLSPPRINLPAAATATTATHPPGSCPTLPLFIAASRPTGRRRQSAIIVCSYKSENGLTNEDKKRLLERYGFNSNLILPETSSKVLGGKAKRKKLLSPKGMDVRPMMEVVKGSAFDILQSAGGCPALLRPGRWLDLYSGTGSVGIEAISRGCSEVHFVEMDPWVVSNVLQPNLECTGFLGASVIHTTRVENFLEQAEQFLGDKKVFDFISVTPPYTEVDYGILMDQISKSAVVGDDTFIVVEYPLRTNMLDACGCLGKITDRRFGRTHLAIYGPKWAQKKRRSEKVASKGGQA